MRTPQLRRLLTLSTVLALPFAPAAVGAPSDYPTAAVADYVYGCMKANGESQQVLQRCACSLDVVASLVPYQSYAEAEAWLSLRQVTGERGALFRTSKASRAAIDRLRRAQAEADVRCF